ncbi:hypothetical protein RHMOL_Rhmol11G0013700 [Rhododendron molle]|uniref:Uncharacterized protein n=1 Tax=Rhododendron molle TaxID=49168 RepID=A0ACC0LMK7_RHOML|nr:hypothetical protein RHMOL_Rhmol11G0013700 [Rhododendron molle]
MFKLGSLPIPSKQPLQTKTLNCWSQGSSKAMVQGQVTAQGRFRSMFSPLTGRPVIQQLQLGF